MEDYKLVETLLVRAQMGMGKTRALGNYINRHFPGNKIIRFVTFCQSFSQSLKTMFPEFVSYKDISGKIDTRHPHAIVQVESLHCVSTTKPIDLLIIDESESVLSQFSSGLHKHFSPSFAAFKWMVKTAKHVVCMDANLGNWTYNTIKRMRPSPPIHLHWNKYTHAKDDKFNFTTNMGDWMGHMLNAIGNGQKILIP